MKKIFKVACHTDNVAAGTTFVAINGTKENGNIYIPVAIEKGATKIVVESGSEIPENILELIKKSGVLLEFVENSRKALAEISAREYNYPSKKLKIVGITGTKGKTTTTFLTEFILRSSGYKTALLSTVKNIILGVEYPTKLTTCQPDYLNNFLQECVDAGVEIVVMEVAAQAFSLYRVHGIDFEIGVFTNFSQEHAEFYSSMDQYFAAKAKIIEHLKPGAPLIINSDDSKVTTLKNNYDNCFDFSLNPDSCPKLSAKIIKSDLSGLELEVLATQIHANCVGCDCASRDRSSRVFFESEAEKKVSRDGVKITSPLVGKFNAQNILAATSICLNLGLNFEQIKLVIKNFSRVSGRLEKFIIKNGATAIIDYAHNPASIEAVLLALRPFSKHLIVLTGAGGDRDNTKRSVMGKISSEIADILILTSDNPRSEDPEKIIDQILLGVSHENIKKVYRETDREKAIKLAYSLSGPESTIVLLGKGPDEYQIIGNTTYPFSETKILASL